MTVADGCHTLNEHQTEANCGRGLFSSSLLAVSLPPSPLDSVVDIAFRPLLSPSPPVPHSETDRRNENSQERYREDAIFGELCSFSKVLQLLERGPCGHIPSILSISLCKKAILRPSSLLSIWVTDGTEREELPFSGTFAQHHNSGSKGDVKGKGGRRKERAAWMREISANRDRISSTTLFVREKIGRRASERRQRNRKQQTCPLKCLAAHSWRSRMVDSGLG